MHTIKVDDEVFALLQKNARPLVDSPNTALRKLLGLRINGAPVEDPEVGDDPLEDLYQDAMANRANRRTKAAKANLKILVRAGLLRTGERLYLVDYQGKRLGPEASVTGTPLLEYKGQHGTMSHLAQELLKKVGFKSNSVRGPAHWVTSKNASVKDLWQQLQEKHAKGKQS
jgi:hypothetical protein